MDSSFIQMVAKAINWSLKTFGSGHRTKGIIKHIKSELDEIQNNPTDLEEWIDVIILAIDGAWRAGYTPQEIWIMLNWKYQKNFGRDWPKPTSQDEPVFHKKE